MLSSSEPLFALRHYVQLRSESVEASLVERTVSIELREIQVPADPERPGDTDEDVSLHVEVTERSGHMEVTVWDRGARAGTRRISVQGSPRLLARRIGLAVVELVRDLRDERLRRAAQLEAERRLSERRALAAAVRQQQEALGLIAGVKSQWWTQGAWLTGPVVGVEFNNHFPLRFFTSAAWMTGSVPLLRHEGRAPVWSTWEFQWGARWVVQPGLRTQLSLGPEFCVSAVHLGSGGQVDGFDGQQNSYSAQAGGVAALSFLPTHRVAARLSLGAARVLRPVPLRFAEQEARLGGTVLSATLSVSLFR